MELSGQELSLAKAEPGDLPPSPGTNSAELCDGLNVYICGSNVGTSLN